MKTVTFGQMKGYPHYLQIKLIKGGGTLIDMVVDPSEKIQSGDKIEKQNEQWKVLEVIEERIAKGNHPKEMTWQRLRCN